MSIEIMKACHGNIDTAFLQPTEVEFVYTTGSFIHPTVFCDKFFYFPMSPAHCHVYGVPYLNMAPEDLKAFFDSFGTSEENLRGILEDMARKQNDLAKNNQWVELFGRIDKKIGLGKFAEHWQDIPEDQVHDAFVEIYQRSEFGFEVLEPIYSEVFKLAHLSKERNERLSELKKKMGDRFTIYHGHKLSDDEFNPRDHYSWTLSKKVAHWFATRYSTPGEVWERTIDFSQAIDYLADRNEEEVLYDYATHG